MPALPLLAVDGLTRPGLAPVTLALDAGAVAVLSGPSGAGKTLLMRAVADLDPNEGRVAVAGVERRSLAGPAWRKRVAYVPADSGWWADTVGAHMADRDKAAGMLARLGLDPRALAWPVSRLSTGERQRLALIRALIGGPDVLLLDEPTSGLDPAAGLCVEALIGETCAAGACALVVSHDPAQAVRLGATRRYRMVGGVLGGEAAP